MLHKLERKEEGLLPIRAFYRRLAKYALLSFGVILVSLVIGIFGYMGFEDMTFLDAFLNAAMLMGGMGPVGVLHSAGGKIFAGMYAMYCGFILLISVAIFITPIFHRLLHHFHLEGGRK